MAHTYYIMIMLYFRYYFLYQFILSKENDAKTNRNIMNYSIIESNSKTDEVSLCIGWLSSFSEAQKSLRHLMLDTCDLVDESVKDTFFTNNFVMFKVKDITYWIIPISQLN